MSLAGIIASKLRCIFHKTVIEFYDLPRYWILGLIQEKSDIVISLISRSIASPHLFRHSVKKLLNGLSNNPYLSELSNIHHTEIYQPVPHLLIPAINQ